jgi:hypothetical protein
VVIRLWQMMLRRIVVIQGHPDPADHHLLHAMAAAYAEAVMAGGHDVHRIDVARLNSDGLGHSPRSI